MGKLVSTIARPTSKKPLIVPLSIVVASIVALSILFVYFSPEYSWSTSIRDHDGDGVADSSDPEPLDADVWAVDTGFVNLTIRVNRSEGTNLHFSVSSTEVKVLWMTDEQGVYYPEGNSEEVDGYGNLTLTMMIRWWNGTDTANVTLRILGDYWGFYSYYWTNGMIVTDSRTTDLELVFPDDFTQGGITY